MAIISGASAAFLSAFAALFTVVNPIGCALVYSQLTAGMPRENRQRLAWRIALNSGFVLVVATWAGGAIMSLLGISLSALRVGGGLVIANEAWRMLSTDQPTQPEGGQASMLQLDAFFPMTVPFTTGPGTIATAIALGAACPTTTAEAIPFVIGISAATALVIAAIAVFYASADRLMTAIGVARAGVTMRLSAFLLLCIGLQILMQGVRDSLR